MGQAPQVKDLAKLHDENVAFLKKITDNIQQTVSADIAKFRDGTKQF